MIFYINYFSLIIFYHSVWLGFQLFGLVQVHRHWVQFTLERRGYDNYNCHNKPQIGNGLECERHRAWKRWVDNLGILKKHVSWELDCRRVELVVYWGASPVEFYSWPIELGTRLGPVKLGVHFGQVESWIWVKTMVLISLTTVFCRSLPKEILKTTRCAVCLSFVSI